MNKPIILIFVACYLPGYKSGGPLRTLSNIVEHLGHEFDFRIVTRDRDASDLRSYDTILVNQWQSVGKAQVLYLSPKHESLKNFQKIIKNIRFDVMYLNSFFDFTFTCKPLVAYLLSKTHQKPVILAPRGEFSDGALHLKKIKKRTYIAITTALNMYQNIVWHASSEHERDEIERQSFLTPKRIHVAMDLPERTSRLAVTTKLSIRNSGHLRILFLSRIAAMKNLDFALHVLKKINVHVIFDIYGPVSDANYWKTCQVLMDAMPQHVHVNYYGCVPHQSVASIYAEYDLFFLPTRGENYGHVIVEALSAGTPVLISDRTPWKNLADERLGWDLSLENELAFVRCIEIFALQSPEERALLRQHIQAAMLDKLAMSDVIEANRQLFLSQVQLRNVPEITR